MNKKQKKDPLYIKIGRDLRIVMNNRYGRDKAKVLALNSVLGYCGRYEKKFANQPSDHVVMCFIKDVILKQKTLLDIITESHPKFELAHKQIELLESYLVEGHDYEEIDVTMDKMSDTNYPVYLTHNPQNVKIKNLRELRRL